MKHTLYETNPDKDLGTKAVLVAVQIPRDAESTPLEAALEELTGLATTAFYRPVANVTQRLAGINPKTYLGKGKVEELAETVRACGAAVVIFDESLSPAQTRNLETDLKCRVIDRTWLILEIFSDHAKTNEAKTQVELARLKYALPRLTKMWSHLSRQRGGIGMKDVGETQIQLDRRLIRDNIHKLEAKLKEVDRDKQTQRKSRKDAYMVALVGYTNVGKSTLMNCLTGADTLVEDKLFATLDATVRRIRHNHPYPILITDTVGLIDKLPHDLVASFKSTLDEVRDADLLLKVTDISHPNFKNQMKTTDQLLEEMGVEGVASRVVFNKIDRVPSPELLQDMAALYSGALFVSGRSGKGIPELQEAITGYYRQHFAAVEVELDYTRAHLLDKIRKLALIEEEKYTPDGVVLKLQVSAQNQARLTEILNGAAKTAALPDA